MSTKDNLKIWKMINLILQLSSHGRCKTPIEEIQAAVDGAISKEQAVKLRQCLDHIDELNKHISELEQSLLNLKQPHIYH